MTPRQKAAQLVFARLGSNMPPPVTVAEDVDRVVALLDRCPLGGLIVFNGDRDATPKHLERLQARVDVPLLVGADIERGAGQQLRRATVLPHLRALAAGPDAEAVVEATSRMLAREARAAGLAITFGPVADVNLDPRNPIIATRAFGEAPAPVARLVQAYIRGCHAEGLLTAAKHFPGHGNTHQDSHAELPVVAASREELEAADLYPFRAAIEAGTDLVMTAHVAYPALDPSGTPATASRPILHTLLREELGFAGAVITDSLLMGGIRDLFPDEGALAAALVGAGVDILLDVRDPEAAVAGLVRAVEAGRLSEQRLDEAWHRVRTLKERYAGMPAPAAVDEAAHRRLAAEAALAAVTEVGEARLPLPIDVEAAEREGLLAILVKPHRSRLDPDEEPLGRFIMDAVPGARYVEVGPEWTPDALMALAGEARSARYVLVAAVVKPAAWHAFGLAPEQQAFVDDLASHEGLILAALGSPQPLDRYPGVPARVCAYSDVAASQAALVVHVTGRQPRMQAHHRAASLD